MQVSPAPQLAIGVQALHTVFAAAEQAVLTYWPTEHVLHAAQLSTVPSTR